MDLETKFETACGDERAACPSDEIQATSDETSDGLDMDLVLAVLAVLILFTLVGLMVMRSRGDSGVEEMKWNNDMLPFNDTVANSMYGGAQDIFQQPVAHVAPCCSGCSCCACAGCSSTCASCSSTCAGCSTRRTPLASWRSPCRMVHGAVGLLRATIPRPDKPTLNAIFP